MQTGPRSPMNPLAEAYLDSRLDELRAALARTQAPGRIEPDLVARFRAQRARARRPRWWWMPPLALAATLALVSWMVRAPLPEAPAPVETILAGDADPGPFLALRPLERIALEPGATVVATEFPRALLANWGLPVSPERAGEPVRAEMLYSPQGEVLAVRLID